MSPQRAYALYVAHKNRSLRRGIGWEISFKEWVDWWGEDIHRRGTGRDQLGMCRFRDEGPYKVGNIYKGTPKENARTRGNMQRKRASLAAHEALEAARDAAIPTSKDWDDDYLTEDEQELRSMFGVRSSIPHPGRFVRDKNV